MKIITVATHSEAYYDAYKQSCNKNNIPLTVLGWNKPWLGLTYKFNLMRQFIEKLSDNDIIIFTDAYDVICLESSDKILQKFISFDKPIVFGIDNPLDFFIPKIVGKFIFRTFYSHIINTGGYIGYASALVKMFDHLYEDYSIDNKMCDQQLFNKFYRTSLFAKENITLDTTGLIFFNAAPRNLSGFFTDKANIGLPIKDNKIINPITTMTPSFLHGPGNINLDKYCKALSLPIRTNRRNQNKWLLSNYLYDILALFFIIVILPLSTIIMLVCLN